MPICKKNKNKKDNTKILDPLNTKLKDQEPKKIERY